MTNLFDSANYSEGLPPELVAGNRWGWKRADLTDVYGTDDYTLEYRFTALESPYSTFEVASSVVSSEFVFENEAADSGDYKQGEYAWQCVVIRTSDSAEVTTDRGHVYVQPDLGANPGEEASPWTYRVLCAIRRTIEGTAARQDASYSIQGRALARRTPGELLELEKEFAQRWAEEKRKIDNANGRKKSNRVLSKMRG